MGLGTIEKDIAVRSTVSLQALVGLLAIVQSWCETVNSKIWIGDELWLAPFTSCDAILGLNVTVDYSHISYYSLIVTQKGLTTVLNGQAKLVPLNGLKRSRWENHIEQNEVRVLDDNEKCFWSSAKDAIDLQREQDKTEAIGMQEEAHQTIGHGRIKRSSTATLASPLYIS